GDVDFDALDAGHEHRLRPPHARRVIRVVLAVYFDLQLQVVAEQLLQTNDELIDTKWLESRPIGRITGQPDEARRLPVAAAAQIERSVAAELERRRQPGRDAYGVFQVRIVVDARAQLRGESARPRDRRLRPGAG